MRRKWLVGLALCWCLAVATRAWSDGVMMDGVSPRSLSRGGTNLGFADNGGVIFDNPSAMVNIDGQEMLDVGTNMLIVSNQYSDPQNPGGVASTTFTPTPQIGLIKKSDDGIWAYGFGLFTPAGFSERYNMIGPDGAEHEYESFGALVKILPALACRLTDRLSIGATLGVGFSYAELQGPYFLQGPTLPGPLTLLHTHGMGADLVWSAGLQYQWSDETTLGATYQSASPFKLRGDTNVDVLAPPLGSSSYNSILNATWPQSVGVGIRHQLSPCQVIACDVIWYDWQDAFDQFTLNLNRPGNPGFPPQITDHFPLDWRDSVSVRLGYEQQLNNGMTFRLGCIFHPNPIPDDTLTPFIQATLEDAVTIGLGWKWGCWDVDVGYVHEFAPQLHEGTSAFIGGDFSDSTHNAQVDAILLDFIRRY
jgi:long-chain fatty acid transport protein